MATRVATTGFADNGYRMTHFYQVAAVSAKGSRPTLEPGLRLRPLMAARRVPQSKAAAVALVVVLIGAACTGTSGPAAGSKGAGTTSWTTSTSLGPEVGPPGTGLPSTGLPGTGPPAAGTIPSTRHTTATTAGGGLNPGPGPGIVSAASTSGQLLVTLTVTPLRSPVGGSVGFAITASVSHATGAVGYQLSYGDGATDQNVVAQFCTTGAGATSQASWTTSHRYSAPGTYRPSVHVYVNCGVEKVTTAPVVVIVS